jgi:hypothetical protein
MGTLLALLAVVLISSPNPGVTPGEADPAVTQANVQQTICRSGYTSRVRRTTQAMVSQVFAAYSLPLEWRSDFEVDHLIPLELGGADTIRNLWPQPYCPTKKERAAANCGVKPAAYGLQQRSICAPCFGAREKDVVETTFKRRVCRGLMKLVDAQQRIAKNWYAEYLKIGRRL